MRVPAVFAVARCVCFTPNKKRRDNAAFSQFSAGFQRVRNSSVVQTGGYYAPLLLCFEYIPPRFLSEGLYRRSRLRRPRVPHGRSCSCRPRRAQSSLAYQQINPYFCPRILWLTQWPHILTFTLPVIITATQRWVTPSPEGTIWETRRMSCLY